MWTGLTETRQGVAPRGEDFYSPWSVRGADWEHDEKGEQYYQALGDLQKYFVWGGAQIQPQPEPQSR